MTWTFPRIFQVKGVVVGAGGFSVTRAIDASKLHVGGSEVTDWLKKRRLINDFVMAHSTHFIRFFKAPSLGAFAFASSLWTHVSLTIKHDEAFSLRFWLRDANRTPGGGSALSTPVPCLPGKYLEYSITPMAWTNMPLGPPYRSRALHGLILAPLDPRRSSAEEILGLNAIQTQPLSLLPMRFINGSLNVASS